MASILRKRDAAENKKKPRNGKDFDESIDA